MKANTSPGICSVTSFPFPGTFYFLQTERVGAGEVVLEFEGTHEKKWRASNEA